MSDSDSSAEANEFSASHSRKRRKQTKEDRMLGVFGSDSDEYEPQKSLFQKTLHHKSVNFQKAEKEQEQSDTDLEEHERPSFRALSPDDKPNPRQDAWEQLKDSTNTRPSPSFGVFSDPSLAFIPSARPAQSRESPTLGQAPATTYMDTRRKKMPDRATFDKSATKLHSGKAAKMMAMMGYKAGEGLGLSGKGIVNPIEAKLRPGQKAGLGSVEEQDQVEQDARRRTPQISKNLKSDQLGSSERTKSRKVKYKTSREIAEEAGGNLVIPKKLQAIIDMTGPEPKKLVDVSNVGYMKASSDSNQHYQVAQNARKQVEQYATTWRTLQGRKAYLTAELDRTQAELDAALSQASLAHETLDRTQQIALPTTLTHDEETDLNRLVLDLTKMQMSISDRADTITLDDVAMSLLSPILQQCMSHWNILSEPSRFVPHLQQLSAIFRIEVIMSFELRDTGKRSSAPFESFMATVWLPRLRTAFAAQIESFDTILEVLEAWAPLTPPFLRAQIVHQLVLPRLFDRIQKWNPKARAGQNTLNWLFQWLPYLAGYVNDLAAVLKRKFILVVNHWKPSDGIIQDLIDWSEIVGQEDVQLILVKQILPKLADHLRRKLVIDPADQKLDTFYEALQWRDKFEPIIMAELLKAEFFPKWINALYKWLKSDPDFTEISQWYQWWQQVLPTELIPLAPVQDSFRIALEMMNTTLDRGAEYLSPPAVGPLKPIDHLLHLGEKRKTHKTQQQTSVPIDDTEITFKDVIDDWCQEHNHLLLPLRRAHDGGDALYRLSANEKGTKGVILYLKGDIVMVLDKENNQYRATSLDELGKLMH